MGGGQSMPRILMREAKILLTSSRLTPEVTARDGRKRKEARARATQVIGHMIEVAEPTTETTATLRRPTTLRHRGRRSGVPRQAKTQLRLSTFWVVGMRLGV